MASKITTQNHIEHFKDGHHVICIFGINIIQNMRFRQVLLL